MLIDHGHPDAAEYPLGLVFDEARLVEDRLNGYFATNAVLTQMAVSALFSKDAGKAFQEMVTDLIEGTTDG